MEAANRIVPKQNRHRGPHLGILAIVFTVLFNAGLYFVISFRLPEHMAPSPSASSLLSWFMGLRGFFIEESIQTAVRAEY